MLGHGTKFGRKKEAAIIALLTSRNQDEAAKSIGIAPNTLLNWQKVPEFQTAYREARRAAFAQSTWLIAGTFTATIANPSPNWDPVRLNHWGLSLMNAW